MTGGNLGDDRRTARKGGFQRGRAHRRYHTPLVAQALLTSGGGSIRPVVGFYAVLPLVTTVCAAPIGPHEAVTAREALTAYPVGSAHAVHEEHIKGTLARGMLADLAVLGDDLLGVAPERIGQLTVGATMAGARITHDTGAFAVS
ncbi:hypothetical protein GCM10010433_51590 [Streptomyces pulveraceus]|uniref:Amidohydrolase family protein n=1 Tax=Streptomyces pulveraceus TaxID=68258 RepID=A0ABW1GXY6_9ACTN